MINMITTSLYYVKNRLLLKSVFIILILKVLQNSVNISISLLTLFTRTPCSIAYTPRSHELEDIVLIFRAFDS